MPKWAALTREPRSIPFGVSILTLIALIVIPLSAVLFWLGWRAVDSLERLMTGRTTFVVAHRLSTLRNVDLILVLDRGRIVERGTHEELLAHGALYRQLYDAQTGVTRQRYRAALHNEPAALM